MSARTSWWIGPLSSAGFFLFAVTLLAVLVGGPCNGDVLSEIRQWIGSVIYSSAYDSLSGPVVERPIWLGCVDSVGGPPGAVITLYVLLLMASGVIGAYLGKGIVPIRGVIGACIGQLLFVEIILDTRELPLGSHSLLLTIALGVTAGLAYAGGWLFKYCVRKAAISS